LHHYEKAHGYFPANLITRKQPSKLFLPRGWLPGLQFGSVLSCSAL